MVLGGEDGFSRRLIGRTWIKLLLEFNQKTDVYLKRVKFKKKYIHSEREREREQVMYESEAGKPSHEG